MKKLLSILSLVLLTTTQALSAEIVKTSEIEYVRPQVTADTLMLFNVSDVLMDSETSLGSQAWRKYLRERVSPQTHDELTLYVFKNTVPRAVEPGTPDMIRDWQKQDIPVFAITSRGRSEWYGTELKGVDHMTERALKQVGLDFSKTKIPAPWDQLEDVCHYFHNGVIYTTNTIDKGELLGLFFKGTAYRPAKVVVVDNNKKSLEEIENAMAAANIPFVGFEYERAAQNHADFDPMIANIQLDYLLSYKLLISDEKAKQIKQEKYADVDAEQFFNQLIEKWNTSLTRTFLSEI